MKKRCGIKLTLLFVCFTMLLNYNIIVFGQDKFNANTNGNISNLAYIAENNGEIFYSNIADASKLYKAKLDGKEEKLVCEDIPNYINVVGDWVYYSNVKEGFKIYKVKKDGSERTQLNKKSSHWIKVIGDWIYYGEKYDKGQELYKVKIDGSERVKVIEDRIFGFVIKDDWIFYSNESDKNKLYKIKLDGSEKTKLIDEASILIDVLGKDVYYQNHDKQDSIYKISIDGKHNTKVSGDKAAFSNISDSYIYYSNVNDNLKLYKVGIDGKNRKKLTDEGVGELNIIGNNIYYWKTTADNSNKMAFDSTKLYRTDKDGKSEQVFKIGKEQEQKEEKMSVSTIVIVLLIVGIGTFMEIWKLISTRNINKFVNNLKGEITNEDAKKYISLIKKSRIVKRSDIYILLRKGVQAINSSYKVDEELKKELDETLTKRGIHINNTSGQKSANNSKKHD